MKPEEIDQRIGMPDIEAEWRRFERDVIGQPSMTDGSRPGVPPAPGARRWMSRAAAIALTCVVSGLVLAATYYLRHDRVAAIAPTTVSIPGQPATTDDSEITPEEDELLSCWDEEAGMYVFDNQELQLVAEALTMLYAVEPVFVNDEARHLRLYLSIVPRERSIEEIVTLLNTFHHVRMHLEDGKLIIE